MENPENVQPTDVVEKKPKKPRLTKEERKARKLEKKRLKALKKLENEKQLIKNQLDRELKYSKKNYEKVTRDWLKFFNQIKSSELKRNLEVSCSWFLILILLYVNNYDQETWAEFNHISDRKDNYIQMMIDDRMELEEKFQWDGEKHLELVNYLMSKNS